VSAAQGIAHAITQEAQLATAFMETLTDPRAPWAAAFERWADGRGLGSEMRRSVRITVLRIRMFGAVERHRQRAARVRR
jgi:hypothetical protein